MTTKERILQESMKLFSVKGFASVSVRSIAKEVGVENSALYKHFKSKQAIFDAIVAESQELFLKKYEENNFAEMKAPGDLENLCIRMFLYQTTDPWITALRRMLIMEMYQSPQMAEVYKKIFVDMPIKGSIAIIQPLIDKGILKDDNAAVMSMELYAPFFLYHTVSEDYLKLEPLLRRHVANFINNYMKIPTANATEIN